MRPMQIYMDGQLVPAEAAKISVFDHGLLYGDGVFEGIRVYNRRIFRLDAHLDRLYASARGIALDIPLERAGMVEALRATVRANRREDGYIRLIVTRGVGDLGVDPRTMQVEVTIGVQRPDKVDAAVVKAALPHGQVTVNVIKGGLDVPDEEVGDVAVIATAAVAVRL